MNVKNVDTVNQMQFLPGIMLILATLLFTSTASAGSEAYPFNKGRSRISLQLGSTRAFDQSYTAVGLGVGYYVIDGLEFGLEGDAWFGNSPDIYRLSPGFRYVLYRFDPVKPYAGIFYRRTFIEGTKDQNEAGGRAGITVVSGPRTNFSIGLVYETRMNCDRIVYSDCTEAYPEFTIAILF